MMLPTIAPIAIRSSLDELCVGVGPAVVELGAADDWIEEPIGDEGVEVPVNKEVWDDERDDDVDGAGVRVEEGSMVELERGVVEAEKEVVNVERGVVRVEGGVVRVEGGIVRVEGGVGVPFVELGGVDDSSRELVVLGGVGPP
jgi:hypothetical protein